MGRISSELKKFESVTVNEPSVFESLKFYCVMLMFFPKWLTYRIDLAEDRQLNFLFSAENRYSSRLYYMLSG